MRILKILGNIEIDFEVPEDAIVESVKINDYLVTEYEEKFDLIFCIHTLQLLWPYQVADAISKMVADLKDKGELHIHVPATDMAMEKFINNHADIAPLYMLWGTVENPFHCGFTLLYLRVLLTNCKGALVREAKTGAYTISKDDQKEQVPEYVVVTTVIRD